VLDATTVEAIGAALPGEDVELATPAEAIDLIALRRYPDESSCYGRRGQRPRPRTPEGPLASVCELEKTLHAV